MKMKTLLLMGGMIVAGISARGQTLQSIDLTLNDTIYVSKSHVSYLDPRGIDLVELDYKSPYIAIGKTNSGILKIVATDDFSAKLPNIYPVAFITPEKTIIKIVKYRPARQSYLYYFSSQEQVTDSPRNDKPEYIAQNKALQSDAETKTKVVHYVASGEDTTREIPLPEGPLFERLDVKYQNAFIPFFKNKIEACLGGIRNDKENYYFIIKIVNKGNKPFSVDYLHMTLQPEEGRKLKKTLVQKKEVKAEILNRMTLNKGDQGHIIVQTPLINVNDESYLFLELFDNQSLYDKEDVRTISFKVRNDEITRSKAI